MFLLKALRREITKYDASQSAWDQVLVSFWWMASNWSFKNYGNYGFVQLIIHRKHLILHVNQISSSFMKMIHNVINFPPESSHKIKYSYCFSLFLYFFAVPASKVFFWSLFVLSFRRKLIIVLQIYIIQIYVDYKEAGRQADTHVNLETTIDRINKIWFEPIFSIWSMMKIFVLNERGIWSQRFTMGIFFMNVWCSVLL